MTKYHKEYYEKNKDRIREYQKTYHRKNKDKIRKHINKYAEKNPLKFLLNACKQRAFLKGLEFSLQEEDVQIPEVCPYLGIPLTCIRGKGRVFSNMSIDRIDSTKGYTKDNIQIISDLANRMKQDATEEQLIAFAKGVLKNHASGTEHNQTST